MTKLNYRLEPSKYKLEPRYKLSDEFSPEFQVDIDLDTDDQVKFATSNCRIQISFVPSKRISIVTTSGCAWFQVNSFEEWREVFSLYNNTFLEFILVMDVSPDREDLLWFAPTESDELWIIGATHTNDVG